VRAVKFCTFPRVYRFLSVSRGGSALPVSRSGRPVDNESVPPCRSRPHFGCGGTIRSFCEACAKHRHILEIRTILDSSHDRRSCCKQLRMDFVDLMPKPYPSIRVRSEAARRATA
jgi:hypothetical protein